MKVHQLIPAAGPSDAVTGQALAWQRALAGWGHEGEIVAQHVSPELKGHVMRLGRRRVMPSGGVLVLHYSIWSEAARVAREDPRPLILCYHNITPAELLRPYDRGIAHDCELGRRALPGFARSHLVVTDSEFNAEELGRAGFRDVHVVPLLLDLPTPETPRRRGEEPTILTVGRIAPNKRLEDVIRVFALYQREHAPRASLVIVGSDEAFPSYGRALRRLVAELGAGGVRFAGRVGDAERDRLYATADAYLCMSVHEGFCVPLVEAMALGLPVVARAAGAIPETLAGVGLSIGDDDLAVHAEALHEVVASPEVHAALSAAGTRRARAFDLHVTEAGLREVLTPVIGP